MKNLVAVGLLGSTPRGGHKESGQEADLLLISFPFRTAVFGCFVLFFYGKKNLYAKHLK